MLPARAVGRYAGGHMWDVASYGDTFHQERERARDESKDYTETRLSPHCANYLSVLSTFIKLQHNPCPEYRLLRLKTIFSTFQLSVVAAWWSCLGRSIIPWPTGENKVENLHKLIDIFCFSATESESDTIIISGWQAPDWPRHSEQLTKLH